MPDGPNALEQEIRETIARNLQDSPTEPGVYLMPCGACVVDFFVTAEGEERWLIPGESIRYTRRSVLVGRHGDEPWRRLVPADEARGDA